MRMVRYDRFGGIDQLELTDVPAPQAAPGSVILRVRASCLNPGSLSALTGSAYVPIRDLSGDVVAVGEGVTDFRAGDAALGWLQDWAAHAEQVVVPATQLIPKPPELPWDVAGSLYVTPMAGLGSVQAVAPMPGELVVVSGASGGVGLAAAQLTRRAGADVIGLGRADHADWLRAHGTVPVEYGVGQEERVRAAAGGRPVAAFIDAAGHGSVELALALGVPAERINTVVDFQAARAHGVQTRGTAQAGGRDGLMDLAALARRGELEIPIAATYPLGQVQEAYRALAARRGPGRIVLHPQA